MIRENGKILLTGHDRNQRMTPSEGGVNFFRELKIRMESGDEERKHGQEKDWWFCRFTGWTLPRIEIG